MKKILSLCLLFVLLAVSSEAGVILGRRTPAGSTMNGTLLEDWHSGSNTGEDGTNERAVWTDNIVHDPTNWNDANTTSSPIGGVEDLLLGATDDDAAARYTTISATGQIAIAWEMRINATTTGYIGIGLDSIATQVGGGLVRARWIWDAVNSDFNLRFYYNSGSNNSTSVTDWEIPSATTFWICIVYDRTGAAGATIVRAYKATTRPTSAAGWGEALVNIENGTDEEDVIYITSEFSVAEGQIGEIIYTTNGTLPYWGS